MLNFVPTPMTVEAASADVDLLADRVVAAEELFFQLESEDADRLLRLDVALAEEASRAGLASLDRHERGRDAVDVDAARDAAGGDDGARLADRTDRGDQVCCPRSTSDPRCAGRARDALWRAPSRSDGLRCDDDQHAVQAEVFDAAATRRAPTPSSTDITTTIASVPRMTPMSVKNERSGCPFTSSRLVRTDSRMLHGLFSGR